MRTLPLKPIRYDQRQVALMVTVAVHFNPAFELQSGEDGTRLALIAAGIIPPTPAILDFFGLQAEGRGSYAWNPR